MSLFTISAMDYNNSVFSTVEEVEEFIVQQFICGKTLATLAREHFSFLNDTKECGKRLLVRLQLIDNTFKTSDKNHKFYNSYDAYMSELRKINKGTKKAERSPESVAKMILTLLENNPLALPIVKAAIC